MQLCNQTFSMPGFDLGTCMPPGPDMISKSWNHETAPRVRMVSMGRNGHGLHPSLIIHPSKVTGVNPGKTLDWCPPEAVGREGRSLPHKSRVTRMVCDTILSWGPSVQGCWGHTTTTTRRGVRVFGDRRSMRNDFSPHTPRLGVPRGTPATPWRSPSLSSASFFRVIRLVGTGPWTFRFQAKLTVLASGAGSTRLRSPVFSRCTMISSVSKYNCKLRLC